jgi:insertion element IS1 protein InsB
MVGRFQAALEPFHVELPSSAPAVILQRLEDELDELWSFVGKKANRQWVWIAMDAATRQVIAFHVGGRSRQSARAPWEKIQTVYQEQALFYTHQYAVYTGVIPPTRHRTISQLAGQTNHVERFNCTLRQQIAWLVRSTLAFSQNLANHIGAIKYFICHYNLTKCAALPESHYRTDSDRETRSGMI